MEIYEIIKNRRKELGLTADQVAEALHISRATVYRYESNEIEKLPITAIEPLAKVLRCSPGYLMGWSEEKEDAAAIKLGITREEQALVTAYRSADEGTKAAVCKLLDVKRDHAETLGA
ncbi:helix-turn-helix domain-containing protein [Butyrivibrio proteoclasticus]|uniref:helix-turn-helix domain-containing protein n=1 Tax=Butyrivibrio proteoclasticus TaxID=43305 RepID=UPI00047DD560|nr:helix-turn-helix transcriptional regulator [Butyrivibrio proteoclasticus]